MIKTDSTPKNEISLMKLTEELLRVMQILCGETNEETYIKF